MSKYYLNLACGDFYITNSNWINLDWFPHSKFVKKANLLSKLPFPNNHFDIVYSSHFLEHIPRNKVFEVLNECYRVLKPNGIIRIVVPDFENIAREYIHNIDKGLFKYSEFNIVEMIDQCVRNTSGGELSRWREFSKTDLKMKNYITMRTGYQYKLNNNQANSIRKIEKRNHIFRIIQKSGMIYSRALIKLLPKWFLANHVNLTNTGELHRWMYDFISLRNIMSEIGFDEAVRVNAFESKISDFPFYPLDIDEMNRSRKGLESMYVEAWKKV